MDASTTQNTSQPSIRQFDCTGCGNALSVLHPRAKEIACPYCGSVLDVNSEAHQILSKMGGPERHEPFSFLKLGMVAEFPDGKYQFISRTRWRQKYKEFWREEGETGYSNEVWIYDEWLLIDENRTYLYLVEDKEGYWISEEIIPETPTLLPRDLRMSFFKGQPERQVQEYGNAEVIYFEGESNYQITKGDQIRFASYKNNGITYSAEWRMVSKDEIKEVEFFQETPISRRKVVEAVGDNEEMAVLAQKASDWNFVYQVARIAMFVFLAMTLWTCTSSGTKLHEQDIPLTSILGENGYLSEPFEIPREGVYKLSLTARDLANNTEVYVFSYILDSEGMALNSIEETFYYYTGYDSEGQWTESDFSGGKRFRVTETGTYRVQFFADSETSIFGGTVRIELNEGVMLTRYAFIALLISIVVMVVAGSKRKV